MDRRRGRRVRRQLPRSAPGGRGGHQRRARPPRPLGVARRAARAPSPLLRAGIGALALAGDGSLDRRSPVSSGWLALRRRPPRAPQLELARSRAATTCSNARAALAALELAGFELRAGGARRWPRSRECCAASSARAHGRGRDLRRLRAPPDRGARRRSRRCASSRPRRLIAVFQPHLYSRTKALARRLRRARSPPPTRSACSTSTRRARSRSGELAGVSGLDVARAAADHAGGRPVWWLRRRRDAPSGCSRRGCGDGRPAGHDRRRRRLHARRRAGGSGEGPDEPCPRRGRARLPARPADDRARRRPGGALRPARRRGASWSSCWRWAGGARASRSRWSARARTCWSPTAAFAAW